MGPHELAEYLRPDVDEVGGRIGGFRQFVEPVTFLEEQDRLRGGPADDLCADGYTAYLAGFAAMDLEGHKAFSAAFYAAIPDVKHRIQEVIAEDERVAVRFRLTGTHSGSFMGHPPSGNAIDAGALALIRTASGRVTELRAEFDRMRLIQQMVHSGPSRLKRER